MKRQMLLAFLFAIAMGLPLPSCSEDTLLQDEEVENQQLETILVEAGIRVENLAEIRVEDILNQKPASEESECIYSCLTDSSLALRMTI